MPEIVLTHQSADGRSRQGSNAIAVPGLAGPVAGIPGHSLVGTTASLPSYSSAMRRRSVQDSPQREAKTPTSLLGIDVHHEKEMSSDNYSHKTSKALLEQELGPGVSTKTYISPQSSPLLPHDNKDLSELGSDDFLKALPSRKNTNTEVAASAPSLGIFGTSPKSSVGSSPLFTISSTHSAAIAAQPGGQSAFTKSIRRRSSGAASFINESRRDSLLSLDNPLPEIIMEDLTGAQVSVTLSNSR